MTNEEFAEKCVKACAGLTEDELDGGWTAKGISNYARKLEDDVAASIDCRTCTGWSGKACLRTIKCSDASLYKQGDQIRAWLIDHNDEYQNGVQAAAGGLTQVAVEYRLTPC